MALRLVREGCDPAADRRELRNVRCACYFSRGLAVTDEEYLEIKLRTDMARLNAPPAALPKPRGVRDTSRQAYQAHLDSGALGRQERLVYEYVRTALQPVTRQEITYALRIGINAVCGRVNSLVAKAILEECGTRHCQVTGQNVTIVKVKA